MIIVDTLLWFKKNSVVRRGGGGGEGHSDEGQHFVWFGMVPASQATFFQSYWDRANAFLLQTGTG